MVELPLIFAYALISIGAFFIAIYMNRLSIVDLVWSVGLALGSLVLVKQLDELSFRAGLILLLILAWSIRLSFYLLKIGF